MKIFKSCVIICLIICFCWIFYLVIYPKVSKTKEVIVPDVLNIDKNEAIEICLNSKLKTRIQYVEDSSENIIISTNPKANSSVKENSQITLYVSKPKVTRVADYCGIFLDDAIDNIRHFCDDNKVEYFLNYVVDNEKAEGLIINQRPSAKTIFSNENIFIDVVIHDNVYVMEDFEGKKIEEAISILNAHKLKYKCIYEYSIAPFGTVLSQSIKPNTRVIEGSAEVVLYISKFLDLEKKTEY